MPGKIGWTFGPPRRHQRGMNGSTLLKRLAFLLPMVLAVGVWAGHQVLASDLLEHHPEYPIELCSLIAPVPEAPAPVVRWVIVPEPPVPVPVSDRVVPESPALPERPPRGPPARA